MPAAASAGRVLSLWDAHDGKPLKQWSAARPLHGLLFSPDGAHVADLDAGRALRIWDIASGQRVAWLVDGEVESPTLVLMMTGFTRILIGTRGDEEHDRREQCASHRDGSHLLTRDRGR